MARSSCGSCRHEQAKEGPALKPCVKKFEQSRRARATFLGWAGWRSFWDPFMKFCGCSNVAPGVQRQRRVLPGKLVVFQRDTRRKDAPRTRCRRLALLVLLEVRFPHRQESARACWAVSWYHAKPERGAEEAQGGQEPEGRRFALGADLAGCVSTRGLRGRGPAPKVGWDVVHEVHRDVLSSEQLSSQSATFHES